MKNIFTTIEYVAEKITEAITGHKNDEQAHPNLSEQINVLSTTHGYVNSNSMGDFNACVKNGKYIVYFNGDGVEQHAPPNIVTGDNTFAVDVTQQSDTVLVQEICGIYGPNQGRKFYRVNTFGTWTDWKEIATEHFYWDLSEINMNNNSTLNDIFNTMKDKSELRCGIVNGSGDIYPRAYGTLKITRITSLIGCAEFSFDKGNRRFIGDFRSVSTNLTAFSGWKEIAVTTKTDILVTPTNGLKVTGNNVSFVEEIAGIKIYHGELEAAAPISDNPIVLTLPKFTSNTWRPVTFVKQDTKEAYGGWCYHGGQVRASLPAGKYNIDIIYT